MYLNKQERRTTIYFCILLALLTLLVAATYTWFSLSHTPRVSEMALYVNAGTGLELATTYNAPDEEWGGNVDFPDLVSGAEPLKPVTWSEEQQSFMTISYGFDGRMTDRYTALSDEENANRADGDGYYVVGTFYARTGESCEVSLAEAVEVNGGENGSGTYVIGTPVWNGQSILHDDGGNGAEEAVRLGFRVVPVDPDTGRELDDSVFYIYEPNCDEHADGSSTYVETPSIDGAPTLSDNLFLQTASTWTEAYPVQREVTIKSLGEFTTDTYLFTIGAGEVYQIQLYVWLEGQDVDCLSQIDEAQIFANVQFHADFEGQGGLKKIR